MRSVQALETEAALSQGADLIGEGKQLFWVHFLDLVGCFVRPIVSSISIETVISVIPYRIV